MPVLASFASVIFYFVSKFTMLRVFMASTVIAALTLDLRKVGKLNLINVLRINFIFKPRITSQHSEKMHTKMTEEMVRVRQSVFAEVVCLREECIMGRLLYWVCWIYSMHKKCLD
jgi:hypothetical protein